MAHDAGRRRAMSNDGSGSRSSVPTNNYLDTLHELEDRLGFLARADKIEPEAQGACQI